jgi:hypothetical protein
MLMNTFLLLIKPAKINLNKYSPMCGYYQIKKVEKVKKKYIPNIIKFSNPFLIF